MQGEFKLILGPMASGKSRTLITELEKFEYANKNVITIQPDKNVRDTHIESRNGLKRDAIKLKQLGDLAISVSLEEVDVVGIDEAFMFEAEDVKASITQLLSMGKIVIASSLDIMANGRMPDTVVSMLELAPEVSYEQAVCTGCDEMDARMTAIFDKETGNQITDLPDVVPDDGTYDYRPVCRTCYFDWS